jgi:hypothetical protein
MRGVPFAVQGSPEAVVNTHLFYLGKRLAELPTTLYSDDPTSFVPQERSDEITRTFGLPLSVAGAIGAVPVP